MKKKLNSLCTEGSDVWERVVENFPLSLQTYDPRGLCVSCNDAWEKLWKIQRKAAIGKYNILKDQQVIARRLLHRVSEAFGGKRVFFAAVPYINPGKTVSLIGKSLAEFLKRKKIKRIYVDNWMYPIFDRRGKVVRVAQIHKDVTKERLREFKEIEDAERLVAEIRKLKGLK